MFKNHKIPVTCLMLAVLFAFGAKAESVFINPGEPGELAQDLDFGAQGVEAGPTMFVWTDNKTLEYDEAGFHFFLSPGFPGNLTYTGFLLDENLDPIPDAVFFGRTPGENDPIPLGVISLQQPTVFRGLLFVPNLPEGEAFDIDWEWDASDRPLVGVISVSAAVVASSLPNSRSVQVGNLASAFGLIINTSNETAMDCGIEPLTEVPAEFVYQTTDASNIPVGMPDTRVDIEPEGSQNFVFAFTPTAPISPTDVQLSYDCSNSEQAPVTSGVNTLLLSASNDPVPDIVALASTPSSDGILNLPGVNGSSAFSVAATNFGSADMITASAVPSMALPISLLICETNPATAACISGPASSVASTVDTGATPTYSIFVTANGTVPFVPETNRIFVEFRDAGDVVRGSTSVAVRTQ